MPQPRVDVAEARAAKRFPCRQCGAKVVFVPGTAVLRCEYCGHENAIPQSDEQIEELDFRGHLGRLAEQAETVERRGLKCTACAAEIVPDAAEQALDCPFCGSNLVAVSGSRRLIKPRSLLAFKVTSGAARAAFWRWIRGLWFAPSALKRFARLEAALRGLYVPAWTYDSRTTSRYSGMRGDDYWVSETYTVTRNGRTETQTRMVRRTRWTPVSGVVFNEFDDVLVLASRSLPEEKAAALEPWDLANLVPYDDAYLSGFSAESYQVDLPEGFERAKVIMRGRIEATIRVDIGGDHQRIHSVRTQYDNVTFKHILLPMWISAYRFRDRVYRVLVNARTGEVQGERPWSWIKITAVVLAAAAAAGAAAWWLARNRELVESVIGS